MPLPSYAQGEDEHVRACVAELARLIKTRFIAADFPEVLRDAGVGGVVSMQLTVARNGTVSGWAVTRGSGNGALDDTALRLVHRLFPNGSSAPLDCRVGAELTVGLPLKFSVR